MIAKADMMNVLLKACPSFAPEWEAFQEEWRDDSKDLPLYLILGDFAQHIVVIMERGETAQLVEIFKAVEQLHVDGDDFVQEAATVGLLEDLQNHNAHRNGTDPEQFRPYLGPESEYWWNKVDRFWQYGEMLSDDRQEPKA
jgi:hypothetical protein